MKNFVRKLKLKAHRLRVKIINAYAKAQPFTKGQFLADCADNSLIIEGVNGVIRPARFTIELIDQPEPRARVTKVPGDDYYFVKVSRPALLMPCFDFLQPAIGTYYMRHRATLDVEQDLFRRMCMACAVSMAYWHEAAHVICGHLDYQEKNGKLPVPTWTSPASFVPWFDPKMHPILPARTMELDADIHGAQFSLAHAMHSSDVSSQIWSETYIRAFAIGVRGLFEYLSEGLEHKVPATTASHLAPITRAYLAIPHAMARLDRMGVRPSDIPRLQVFSQCVLLDFEINDLGMTVNPGVLQAAQETELELWSRRHKEFVPYQPKPSRKAA